jgi:Na+-transporting NADH:ubiquinone oxidoreductase subunit F
MAMLTAMATMIGLVVLLLVVLVVIKRYVAVYGDNDIEVNLSEPIRVHGGQTLTAALAEKKIYLPSACGGKGTCGFCRVKVTDGLSEASSIEEAVIPYRQITEGIRLGCQTRIRQNMSIEVPEEYLAVKQYRGRVTEIEALTHDIKRFNIELIEPKTISFKSGQYVVVEPVPGETRAYSIASLRRENERISLEVKKVPNGLCSTYLHALQMGEELAFFGPYGDFYLRNTPNKVICVAGGVGLAPMKSIIDEALTEQTGRKVELYYGARTIDDMYDYEKYISLTMDNENFKFYPALSDVHEIMTHPSGFVFDSGFISSEIEKRVQSDEPAEAYLCGPPIMIDTSISALRRKGVPDSAIFYDKF